MVYKKREMDPIITTVIFLFLFGISCTAKSNFGQIKVGMSKADVITVLGKPLQKSYNILPLEPFWGPQEAIDSTKLNGKREYEEWKYIKSETIYLIWFGGYSFKKNEWKIIGKTSYPEGVVF